MKEAPTPQQSKQGEQKGGSIATSANAKNSKTNAKTGSIQEEEKKEGMENGNKNFYNYGVNEFNKIKFKMLYEVDKDDNSLVNIKVMPL